MTCQVLCNAITPFGARNSGRYGLREYDVRWFKRCGESEAIPGVCRDHVKVCQCGKARHPGKSLCTGCTEGSP